MIGGRIGQDHQETFHFSSGSGMSSVPTTRSYSITSSNLSEWTRQYVPNQVQTRMFSTPMYTDYIRNMVNNEIASYVQQGNNSGDIHNYVRENLLLRYPQYRQEIQNVFLSLEEGTLSRDDSEGDYY